MEKGKCQSVGRILPKHQLIVSRFFVKLLFDDRAGDLCDHQLAGGVDDAPLAQMPTDGA